MSDQMRFTPAQITVKQGEIVRFEPVNKGQVMHEMVLGTLDDLKKHAELMKKNPGMPHDAPHMAHVAPGKSGKIGWQFTKPGEFFYACLVAGHFEAGMIGKVTVQSDRAGDIKALSSEEVEQYLSGAGMGYAKAAELNRHPGPMHVLELADQLKLTAEQRTATAKLMEAHKAEARKIGARLVAAERALDELFRGGAVAGDTLAQAVARTAVLEGEYRLAHLETHRRMRTLLSDAQLARYDALRGYAAR
jgi:plastocyanin